MSIGQRLRRQRESLGLTLEEVAAAIKVASRLIEALERDDLAALPGGPFNKGFVRSYARHVGLDPEQMVGRYGREEKARGLWTPDADRELDRERSRLIEVRAEEDRRTLVVDMSIVRAGAGIVVLVAVAAIVAFGLRAARSDEAIVAAASDVARAPAGLAGAAGEPADPPTDLRPAPDSDLTPGAALTDEAADPAPDVRPAADGDQTPADNEIPAVTQAASVPTPSNPAVPDESALAVPEAGVGRGVIRRRLVDPDDRFAEGEHVWFWTRAVGGIAGETIRHVWLRDGRYVVSYDLTVGGPHWRNASRKTLSTGSVGTWTVEARGSDGRVLAHADFVCTSGDRAVPRS